MKIIIAPNAFKNSLTSSEAALFIKQGFHDSGLVANYESFPIADGGDGTAALIIQKCGGQVVNMKVRDPLGREIQSSLGLINGGKTAIIEMADASGIRLLQAEELNPMVASSYGTGELIRNALDLGVGEIFLGMGGSATVDGGTGILRALGVRFLDEKGSPLEFLPYGWASLSSIDLSGLDERILKCKLTILCDVGNPLLGKNGASQIFGPQKGANLQQVDELDAFLQYFANITLKQTGVNMAQMEYSGTAGGAAAGVNAFLNARLVSGIEYFLMLTQFEEALKNTDFLITGEGALDQQTLQGKGPVGVAKLANQLGIPVIALAGNVSLSDLPELRKHFKIILPIGNQPMSLTDAMKLTGENLSRTARELGHLLKIISY